MSSWLGLIQQALFFAFITIASIACAVALVYPLFRRRLQASSSSTRSSIVLGLCLLPIAMTMAVLVSALLPSLLQLAGLGTDHCAGHEEGHQHFCLVHRPSVLDSDPLMLLAMACAGVALIVAARLAADLSRIRNFRRLLARYAVVENHDQVNTLATDIPLAFSTGILRPRIFLSTGLLDTLSDDETRLVIAHEAAHATRRDGLRLLLARAFSLAHLPFMRRLLLADLQVATEMACDAIAARQAHDASALAALLLKIERVYSRHFPAQAPLAFGVLGEHGSTLAVRVQALLAPPVESRLPWAPAFAFAFVMLALLGGHDALHDSLEHSLDLFMHR